MHESSGAHGSSGFFRHIPAKVWLAAVAAALLHIAPVWRAQLQTPAGWTFTGNISRSPDYMQYRAWMRQTQETGILVGNRFTAEPHRPYLPVAFFYSIGKTARWTGVSPELVYAYTGCLFAFCLTVLLFATARHFLRSPTPTWTVFAALMLGGGLGAHIRILSEPEAIRRIPVIRQTLAAALDDSPVFEDFRDRYVINVLFDSHALFVWLLIVLSLLSLYFTLRHFSWGRAILTACLFAAMTLFHLYEGVTLMLVSAMVTVFVWCKGLGTLPARRTLALGGFFVALSYALWLYCYSLSGIPLPAWREPVIPFSYLLIAYPLALGIIAWGVADYWREGGLEACFLLGWGTGCIALVLSAPFYMYSGRGTITLQIPLFIVAGSIYFSRRSRLSRPAVLLALLVMGAAPALMLARMWLRSSFRPDAPYTFMSAGRREVVEVLRERAVESDILAVHKSDVVWNDDDLWLAPDYPGKLFCSHAFLTVDYERKRAEIRRFFQEDPPAQARFLREKKIRFVYAGAGQNPKRLEQVPGLVSLKAETFGSLFEYKPESASHDSLQGL